jgi:hypothetical protein
LTVAAGNKLVLRDFVLLLLCTPDQAILKCVAALERRRGSLAQPIYQPGSQAKPMFKLRAVLNEAATRYQIVSSAGIPRQLVHWRQMVDGLLTSYRWFDDDGGGAVSAEEISAVLEAAGDTDLREDYAINKKERDRDPLGDGLVRLPAFVEYMIDGLGAWPWMKQHPLQLEPDALPSLAGISEEMLLAAIDAAPGSRNAESVDVIAAFVQEHPFSGKVWKEAANHTSNRDKVVVPAVRKELCQRFKSVHLEQGTTLFDAEAKLSVRAGTSDFCLVLQGSVQLMGPVTSCSCVLASVTNAVHTFSYMLLHLSDKGSAVMIEAQNTRAVFGEHQVHPVCLSFMHIAERLAAAAEEWLTCCIASQQRGWQHAAGSEPVHDTAAGPSRVHDLMPVFQHPAAIERLHSLLEALHAGEAELEQLRQLVLKRFSGLRLKGIPLEDCSKDLDLLCTVRHGARVIEQVVVDLSALNDKQREMKLLKADSQLMAFASGELGNSDSHATEVAVGGIRLNRAADVVVGELKRGACFGNLALQQHEVKPRWPVGAKAGPDGCMLLTVGN